VRLIKIALVTSSLTGATSAAVTFDAEDLFPLAQNSQWHYTGDGQPGSSSDDDFTWHTLADLISVHGTMATQIETLSDEPSDSRNLDRDFWSVDGSGNLLFHGFHNGQADGSGLTQFPVQDVILDEPFLAGTENMTVGTVLTDVVTASNITVGFLTGLTVSAELTTEYVAAPLVVNTPLGVFRDCVQMNLTVRVTEVSGIPFPINREFRAAELYLKASVGMVLQDQDADPNDAEIQAIDAGMVGGVPIVPDGPPMPPLDEILDAVVGVTAQSASHDVNGDTDVDAADVVTRVNAIP
jgi:hypothetical protein